VYVPWIPFEDRGAGLPPDFQINGAPAAAVGVDPLDLSRFLAGAGTTQALANLVGPFTADTGGFLPARLALPYTVHFQNDPNASADVSEVRIVTQLDPNLDPRTFRLGDIKVGDIDVHIPSGRGLFQGDFDFTQTKGFILRISAGVDLKANQATWLIQA